MALGLLVSFACETINHLLYQVWDDGYIKKSIEGQSHAKYLFSLHRAFNIHMLMSIPPKISVVKKYDPFKGSK